MAGTLLSTGTNLLYDCVCVNVVEVTLWTKKLERAMQVSELMGISDSSQQT
jgi:hypothetical protein